MFWASSIAFGASSFGVLSFLSDHGATGTLATASAVLSLMLLTSVLPSAVQLRTASLMAAGHRLVGAPWGLTAVVAGGIAIAAPAVAPVLDLPALAVALVAAQLLPALPLAMLRGVLIGSGRMWAAGANLAVEGLCRFFGGVAMGLAWHGTGVALAIVGSTLVALVVGRTLQCGPWPVGHSAHAAPSSSVTPLLPTMGSLGLITLTATMDLIAAPGAMGRSPADLYNLAAVPAKAIFASLLPVGLISLRVARGTRRAAVVAIIGTLVLGLLGTAILIVLRPVIPLVFGQEQPDGPMLAVLGLAMSAAAATSACIHVSVARGGPRPWLPLLFAALAITILAVTGPRPFELAVGVLIAHVFALGANLLVLVRSRRLAPRSSPVLGPAARGERNCAEKGRTPPTRGSRASQG